MRKATPLQDGAGLLVFRRLRLTAVLYNRPIKVVRMSALCTNRLYPSGEVTEYNAESRKFDSPITGNTRGD